MITTSALLEIPEGCPPISTGGLCPGRPELSDADGAADAPTFIGHRRLGSAGRFTREKGAFFRLREFTKGRLGAVAKAFALASAMFCGPLKPAAADGAIVFPADQQASWDVGAALALADKVRQVQFDVVAGSIPQIFGTATPLGPWYSGISKHYFDYIASATGSSNFSMSISTGVGRNSRLQTVAIESFQIHPTMDFVILKHDTPIIGAALPVFGSIARRTTATFVGFGDDQVFGNLAVTNDGLANAFNMFITNTSNPISFSVSSDFALGIPGGGKNFDSSSPGYNDAGQLSLFLQTGAVFPMDGLAGGGALAFVESGLGAYVLANTPQNYVIPELSSTTLLCLAAVAATVGRRKRQA